MTDDLFDCLLAAAEAPQRKAMAAAMLCAAIAAIASVLLLGLSGWFITGAALAGAAGVLAVQAFNYLLPSAAIRLLAILRTASRYGERLYGHRAALLTLAGLRASLFARLIAAPDLRALSAGEAVTRLVQDIGAIEDRLIRKPAWPAAIAGSAVGLALCGLAGWAAMLALLTVLVALPLAARAATPRLLERPAQAMAAALGALKADFTTCAAASPEIAAYGMAPAVAASLQPHVDAFDSARRRLVRGEALVAALSVTGAGVAMAAVLGLSTAAPPITALAVLAAAGAVESLAALIRSIAREAAVDAGIARIAALAPPVDDRHTALSQPAACRIDLSAPGGDVHLDAGDRLAITGPSGSGKTWLLETLAGIRPATGDVIRLDGMRLSGIDHFARRAPFALSPQDALLISGSIADNLRLARPGVTRDDMWTALDTACLADHVRSLPEGLDFWVGDSGTRLSGGQRKRLSIARALLAGRPWLLLDEPSEGLDPATENELIARLDAWLRHHGAGLILVTHRPEMLGLAKRRLDLAVKGAAAPQGSS